MNTAAPRSSAPTYRILIGAVLMLFGFLVVWGLWTSAVTAISQRGWEQAACTLDSAEIVENPGTTLTVRYHFELNGKVITGTQYELPSPVVHERRQLEGELRRLAPESTVPCWIPPDKPEGAVLRREDLTVVFLLGFGLMLCVGGLAVIASMFRGSRPQAPRRPAKNTTSKEAEEQSRAGSFAVFIFFGLFIAAGLGMSYLLYGASYLAVRRSMSWTETRCTISSSSVVAHTSSRSSSSSSTPSKPTYSIEVAYQYVVGNNKYIGDVYGVGQGATSGWAEKEALVSKLEPGTEVPCFVNPNDPFKATLVREYPANIWGGLFPLIFSVGGLLGLLYTTGNAKVAAADKQRGPGTTRRATSRVRNLLTLIAVALVWNGITGAVVYGVVWEPWTNGYWPIIPLLISIPFTLIGLLLVLFIPYGFLQLFNPSLDLQFSDKEPIPGSRLTCSWNLNGKASRVRNLEIVVKLISRGASDQTVKKDDDTAAPSQAEVTLATITVVSTDQGQRIERGSAEVLLPALDSLPAPKGKERRSWRISYTLSIPLYPDAGEMWELPVGSRTE